MAARVGLADSLGVLPMIDDRVTVMTLTAAVVMWALVVVATMILAEWI